MQLHPMGEMRGGPDVNINMDSSFRWNDEFVVLRARPTKRYGPGSRLSPG
jgi:hypothetical protein